MTQQNRIDYRYWLVERFLQSRRKNPKVSLRAFAKRIGISHSALSEILSGKRPLTEKTALRLSEKLSLTPTETKLFLNAVRIAGSYSNFPEDGEVNEITDKQFTFLDLGSFKAISEWYYYAILCLGEIKGSKFDSQWVAKRLGISENKTKEALARLQALDLIRVSRGQFRASGQPLSFYSEGYEPAIRSVVHQGLEKAALSLEHDPAEYRELSSTTMAIDPKNLPKAREAIKRFRRELTLLLEKGDKKRVYLLAVQLVPLDKSIDQSGEKND